MAEHDLLLHVGAHKTGTTAVQAYLRQCRAALAAQGVLYPSLRPGWWREMDAHHKVAQALARLSLPDRWRLARYRRHLDRAQSGVRLTVLSAEPVFRHVLGRPAAHDLEAWFAAHRAYLRRLAAWLGGFRVEPLVYLREPADFAISMYKEHVVRRLLRGAERGLGAFLDSTAHYYAYAEHVAALREVFGDANVRDYGAARRRGLLVDFTEQLGVANLPPPARDDVRSSPSNRATLWLAHDTRTIPRRDHYRRVLFAVRTGRSGPFAEDAPTTLWPDAATFARFVERHGASWDLPCVAPPVWRELPPTAWTPTDHAAADAAFRDWERRHLELLRAREARGLAFYEPDPA